MKLTKALYFIAFLLAINVLVPGSNNYVEAKPAKANENSLANKIKNNKVAFLATLIGTLALAAAGTTFGVMQLKKKKGSKPNPVSDGKKTPAPAPEKKPVPASDNKSKPSTPEPTTRSSPTPETNLRSSPSSSPSPSPTPAPTTKPSYSSLSLPMPEPSENPTIFSYNPNMYRKVN
ncbi:Malarial early transcribed membrane protein (ETRAMP), putative [Plasmodium chabaudi adami]|uniref:Malarial early transcribed membrane protein (ETRAMP), putative n=1 Tax=Plasmodium chabaudi adami TaxID=5826 RepID=A0A1C6WFD0_PLACE|nr:Malarial early transcribed membrane protein (ETRAMP), putative [Plasmodium chabaudi adami]